jgi:hypothetical protein
VIVVLVVMALEMTAQVMTALRMAASVMTALLMLLLMMGDTDDTHEAVFLAVPLCLEGMDVVELHRYHVLSVRALPSGAVAWMAAEQARAYGHAAVPPACETATWSMLHVAWFAGKPQVLT